jgi:DNA-nicking Smr family endonuclease
VLDGADAFYEAMADATPLKRRTKADKPAARVGTKPGLPGLPSSPEGEPAAAGGRKPIPPLADFDRKSAKRLRAGQTEIEARIDLHGMRQGEAQDALRAFLMSAHARGLRFVLVITGKGAPRRPGASDEAYTEPFDMTGRTEKGVLRRNVPRWLAEPDLRAIVVSVTEAAIPHGGGGALYVQLRRRGGVLGSKV